jgi:dolichol-phosphate hexosyltransferase
MANKKVTLMVPCHNEEKGIVNVMYDVKKYDSKKHGYDLNVLVIDNNSTDNTAKVAKKLGAKVILEKKKGKGNAIRAGFSNIPEDTDYVVMIDGDNTYKPYEMHRLLELLESGFSDAVIGSRLEGRMLGKAMSSSHRLANWFFTFLVRRLYRANVTDTCTGYFAWKKDVVIKLNGHAKSPGFAIEAEMITKMARLGIRMHSVPISYDNRDGDSKLSPVMDGIKITMMLLKNVKWKARG